METLTIQLSLFYQALEKSAHKDVMIKSYGIMSQIDKLKETTKNSLIISKLDNLGNYARSVFDATQKFDIKELNSKSLVANMKYQLDSIHEYVEHQTHIFDILSREHS